MFEIASGALHIHFSILPVRRAHSRITEHFFYQSQKRRSKHSKLSDTDFRVLVCRKSYERSQKSKKSKWPIRCHIDGTLDLPFPMIHPRLIRSNSCQEHYPRIFISTKSVQHHHVLKIVHHAIQSVHPALFRLPICYPFT